MEEHRDLQKLVRKSSGKSKLQSKEIAIKREIEQVSGNIVRLESQKRSGYEQYVLGKLSKEKFLELKQGLENEITTLKQTKAEKEKGNLRGREIHYACSVQTSDPARSLGTAGTNRGQPCRYCDPRRICTGAKGHYAAAWKSSGRELHKTPVSAEGKGLLWLLPEIDEISCSQETWPLV